MPFKSEPFKDLNSLQDKMGRILNDSISRLREIGVPESEKPYLPPVDIFELTDSFVLLAEVPGVPKETISVELLGGSLVIKGEKPQVAANYGGNLHHSERRYGPFERTFNLPVNVEPERITAKVSEGILTVTINKPEEETRRVHVNVE